MNARGALVAFLLALGGVAGISLVQPSLARSAHKVRQRDDVFLLPPPAELRAMTLGYRAATTDLLWAQLLLEVGLHWQEKRPFPYITRYIDGILSVEPDFPTIYDFVDTMIMFPPPPGANAEDARITRRYLERGVEARPFDANVWLHYGQFITFLAQSFLTDKEEIERWRTEGALALMRAVELGSDAQRSLAAVTILSKSGERKATIEHLQRAYAMTDDVGMREQFALRLKSLQADAVAEDAVSVVDRAWQTGFPFLSRGTTLLLGPRRSATLCAGTTSYTRRGCPRDWQQAVDEAK